VSEGQLRFHTHYGAAASGGETWKVKVKNASAYSTGQSDFSTSNYPAALAAAQTSDLLPGDVIYIPPVWWHQVESSGKLNILINYWWDGSIVGNTQTNSPSDCLLHCLINLKHLPPETRAAWGTLLITTFSIPLKSNLRTSPSPNWICWEKSLQISYKKSNRI
jgi:hypothetical protein